MKADVSKEVLVGALLWLRNHYDVGQPELKEAVIARIDRVLEDAAVAIKDMRAFGEAYPVEEKKRKKPLSWRTCPECMSRATKILSLNTGLYQCQICLNEYEGPRR